MSSLMHGQQSAVVFMFPGQGCQFYQMGRELYQNNPVFYRWMNNLDALIHAELGRSVIAEMYDDKHARAQTFDDIRVSHPAIFMIEYALGKTLIEQQILPSYLLGASLGELAAAALAEVLPLADAVRFVIQQGLLFHRHQAPATEGTMLAVLAGEALYQQTPLLREHCEIAAHHAHSLFVLAGPAARMTDVERYLSSQSIVFQRLPVKHAFHSRYIDYLQPEITALAHQLTVRPAQIPMVSCSTAEISQPPAAAYFWHSIRAPIRFSQTLTQLERTAAARGESLIYLDLGPSGTLANLVKQNLRGQPSPQIFPVLSPFGRDLEKFDAVLAACRALQPLPAAAAAAATATAAAAPMPPAPQPTQPPAAAPAPAAQQPVRLTPAAAGRKRVYVFPGQGSQRLGMGAALFEQFPDHLANADQILGYSLKTLCTEDPHKQLSNTQYTQPALYTVSALAFLSKQQQDPRPPDFLAGHSLGEYCALFAAGAFSFETGLKLVKKRGELMARASGGSMAAVIGRTPDEIRALLTQYRLDALDIANYNSRSQSVLAGPVDALSEAKEIFQKLSITLIPLSVSAPFHSRYMRSAMDAFGEYLKQFQYAPLRIPVISNLHAAPYRDDALISNLTGQICGSVRWLDTIEYLLRAGASEFEELGPGNVLSKLIDSIRQP